jgi:hypothetical protein
MRKYLSLALFAILFVACCQPAFTAAFVPQAGTDEEEFAVWAAWLKAAAIGEQTTQVVITDRTEVRDSPSAGYETLVKDLDSLRAKTAENFRLNNEKPVKLTNGFNLKVKVNLISRDEMSAIFQRRNEKYDGWEFFRQRYPTADAIITFSRVGFNGDKTQALMYVGYQCDWLCGEGSYVLLAKEKGDWKIKKKVMIWIS